ncbi:hypothetical protein [Streptomyces luteocolor]|uniref:hypothetical protein n=1 Tax=Streptomyces luteocolor TaxID=285500 RepID=UPI000853EE9E|nr:hypothetical protein [Streptomyces luteocolor]
MSSPLPERPPIHAAPATGQAALSDAVIEAAIANAIEQAKRHGTSPQAVIGTTPPVAQPGIPPMTFRETQIGRVALYGGAGVSLPILAGAVFMVATEHANPAVIAWGVGGITALSLLVATFGYLVKRIVAAASPPEVHNHIAGDVYQDQRQTHSKNIGINAKTNNQQ